MSGRWTKRSEEQAKEEPAELTWDETWPFNPDSPVLEDIAQLGRPLSIMLVDLTGLEWAGIEPLLPVVRRSALEKDMLPVLIVDLLDYKDFRNAGFAYDALPNVPANKPFRPDQDWDSYLSRRRRLLVEKWKPAAIVRLSEHAGDWE